MEGIRKSRRKAKSRYKKWGSHRSHFWMCDAGYIFDHVDPIICDRELPPPTDRGVEIFGNGIFRV